MALPVQIHLLQAGWACSACNAVWCLRDACVLLRAGPVRTGARGPGDCRPGQRNSGKNRSAKRPAGTRRKRRDAGRDGRARWKPRQRRRYAPSQPRSCGSDSLLCLGKPMRCLRCLKPPASAVAAGSVPSVLHLRRPSGRKPSGQGCECDVTCSIGCESIAAGFVWSSGNTRTRESFLGSAIAWMAAAPLQHLTKPAVRLQASTGKGLRPGKNVA